MKSFLAATVLVVFPFISQAECYGGHTQQVMSCADGNVWDADKATCVPVVTG